MVGESDVVVSANSNNVPSPLLDLLGLTPKVFIKFLILSNFNELLYLPSLIALNIFLKNKTVSSPFFLSLISLDVTISWFFSE